MVKVPKGLIEETKAMIRLYLFLRHECGLKYADRLGARELKQLLLALKSVKI